MRLRCPTLLTTAMLAVSVTDSRRIEAAEQPQPDEAQVDRAETSTPRTATKAIESGLSFLASDAVKWRTERGCVSCHHGTMTIWTLSEAKAQGYAVGTENLADLMQWTKEQMVPRIATTRDPRPGWKLVSVAGMYLGVMSQNLPILSRDEVSRVALHLARHQEEDGSFLLPPPLNGAPPIWESSETLALWSLLAWEPSASGKPDEVEAAKAGREKTLSWLSKAEPTNTTQSTLLRLLLDLRTGRPAEERVSQLLKLQNADGGWSQTQSGASDAYATGQAMYALTFAGLTYERPEIQRAIAYLVASQADDGSWPMTSHNHPGVEATKDPVRWPVPIRYFGSAWATLGLVRSVPSPPDTAPKQRRAFDKILGFHGKYGVDEADPQHSVVSVDLRYYEVSDKEVGDFVEVLPAFPRLTTLQFKSSKITDLGVPHLKALPQLRVVDLENAAITDAGLATLKEMKGLEQLNLKGTKVSDAGVHELQQALPNVKVER